MKRTTLLCIIGFVVLAGIWVVKLVGATKPRFSFSYPIHSGSQEIRANLPPGRYALTVTTNFSRTAFGVVPAQRDYGSQLAIQVRSKAGLLIQATNFHYLVFSLSGDSAGPVEFSVQKEMGRQDELLVLNLGRGF
jgi:hypothetical protein